MENRKDITVEILSFVEKYNEEIIEDMKRRNYSLVDFIPEEINEEDLDNDIIDTKYCFQDTHSDQALIYICEYFNRQISVFNSFNAIIYSYVEALMKRKAKQYKFNIHNKKNNESYLRFYTDIILNNNKKNTNKEVENLIHNFDNVIRNLRNKYLHELPDLYTIDNVIEFIGNGKQVGYRLSVECAYFEDCIRALFSLFKRFIELYRVI